MKIFYQLSNSYWDNVEENFKDNDIDVLGVETDYYYDDIFENKIKNRKCIYHQKTEFIGETMGMILFHIPDIYSFNRMKNQFVSAIGDDKDIVILIQGFSETSFLKFFRQLQQEMNLNLNIIAGVYENSESDTYHQLLRNIYNLDKFSSACIFNYAEISNSSLMEDICDADEIICSELPEILKKLSKRKYRGFAVYNHKLRDYERFYIPDNYINDDEIVSDIYFYENAVIHDKSFCSRLKEYKKEFARKHDMRYKKKACNYNKPCRGTCSYCEFEADKMWHKSYEHILKKSEDKRIISINGIERLREDTDGFGIRSLVLIGGCPLNCKYCGNAEYKDIFIGSKSFSVSQLGRKLEKDGIYFEQTGGGVTFGGGEPLLQSKFILDFCNTYNMWNVDIETSLNVDFQNVQRLADCIDVWHIDIKDMNPNIYRSYTGKDNSIVIENLEYLIKKISPERLHIRVPEIPDFNSENDIQKSVETLRKMGFTNIEIFEYKI